MRARKASPPVMRPISTSCVDHLGANAARVHTWDGAKFVWSSDWLEADDQIIKPMVKASAGENRPACMAWRRFTPSTYSIIR